MIVAIMTTALSGTAWADSVTFNYSDYKGKGTNSTGAEYTMAKNDVSITNTKFYGNTSYAHFYANGTTTITPAANVTITQIVLTASATNYNGYQSGGTITASTGEVSCSNTTVTWTGSATAAFTLSNNKQIRWTSIVVTYTKASGTPTCATPTFSPAGGAYTSAQNVTISTETSGATIYYTIDGAEPTTNSSVYSSAIPVSSTTTIKAMATAAGYDNSSVATAKYVFTTHAGTEADPYTVAEARALIDANVGLENKYATGIVSQIVTPWGDGGYQNITFNLVDEEGDEDFLQAFRCVGTDAPNVLVGDVAVVSGDLTKYNSTYEFAAGCTVVSLTHPSVPTIGVNPATLSGFTYEVGNGPSTAKTFTVLGTSLTTDITLSLTGDYEMSLTENGTYSSSLSLTQTSGEVASTTVYVRLKADLDVAESYTGTITLTSTGATNQTVSLSGSVTAPEAPNVTWDLSTDETATATTTEMTWTSTYATMAVTKGSSSTATNNYYPGTSGKTYTSTRFYSGSNLAITPATGYAITSVVFTATSANYATALESSTWTNATASASGTTVTVTPTNGSNAISATIGGTCGFTSVKVYYEEDDTPLAPVINANDVELAYNETSGEIAYTVDNPVTGTAMTATSSASWISNITVGESSVTFETTTNEGDEDRSATITLTYGEVTKNVTVTQAAYVVPVADYATLPFSWAGGASADLLALAGVTANGLGSDYASGNAPYLVKFDGTGDYIQVKTDSRPGIVTIGVKMLGGNSASTIIVQESADGETFTNLQSLSISGAQNSIHELSTTTAFAETSRYVRLYFNKGSNVGVGPITIAQYEDIVLNDYTLTIDDPANVTITATYGDNVIKDNGDVAEVTEGTVITLAVTPATGYVFQSLTIAGAEEGQIVTPTEAGGVYTFSMPAFDVTVSATVTEYVAPVTAQYTLATSITSGKRYVIASGTEGTVKVMAEDRGNNRGAVEATITNGVLSVSDEYEFVIESVTGGYSIYDESAGYLYAASSSSNYLKTEAELDENNNGIWAISFDAETSAASIVAQGTNTRNVIRFNSSNNPPIFACYESGKQSPVYLFEKVEEVPTSQTVAVSAAGYATFVAAANLEIPEGVEVFAVTVNDGAASAHLEAIESGIPAGEAVLVKASPDTYEFTYTDEVVAGITNNDLRAATTDITADGSQYCLAQKNDVVGFYKVQAGIVIPAGKAYLVVTAPAGGEAKAFYGFDDDDATGISNLKDSKDLKDSKVIYNLAGQRLSKMQRGINIVNGKKVLY